MTGSFVKHGVPPAPSVGKKGELACANGRMQGARRSSARRHRDGRSFGGGHWSVNGAATMSQRSHARPTSSGVHPRGFSRPSLKGAAQCVRAPFFFQKIAFFRLNIKAKSW
ncbi:MAG: hypothetical protein A2681_00780 [Candidatus Liptonbacteria bacterium RIFCSPHIGHO2_01_FULL_56_18b]|nr:MAG: hypothetical protein A2681_00780 [Candidatus Liptonbacteria bacterium RIFCSPHIGHO2_01_FULL_56_18b]